MPEAFDLVFNGIAVLIIVLAVAALIALIRQQAQFSVWEFIAWAVVIVALPVAGSALFLGRSIVHRGKRNPSS